MNWFISLFVSRPVSRQVAAHSRLASVERAEPRLCLGGLGTPATDEPYVPPHPGPPAHALGAIESTWHGNPLTADHACEPVEGPRAEDAFANAAPRAHAPQPAPRPAPPKISAAVSSRLPEAHSPAAPRSTRDAHALSAASHAEHDIATLGPAIPTYPVAAAAVGPPVAPVTAAAGSAVTGTNADAAENGSPAAFSSGITADQLASLGLRLDEQGNAVGIFGGPTASGATPWWSGASEPVTVRYDFRSQGGFANQITDDQQVAAVAALEAWSEAAAGKLVFVRDTHAPIEQIVNIGTGDLAAFNRLSAPGGVLSLGGGRVMQVDDAGWIVAGAIWLDHAETWDTVMGNGDPLGTYDYFTAVAHETGHVLGYDDAGLRAPRGMMTGMYNGELGAGAISQVIAHQSPRTVATGFVSVPFEMHPLTVTEAQLAPDAVKLLLERAAAASASDDGIFAVVDRNGRILGVRVEAQALAAIPDAPTLVFAIDGAVAKARTAAFFSNGDPSSGNVGPLTSRLIQFISQSTITQREVESNPNADGTSALIAASSTVRGPGFVAPIGLGGHFPPAVAHTPPVDLFAIEHTNRDSNVAPGDDGIRGTADDVLLRTYLDAFGRERGRFNIDPAFVPADQGLFAPESYGNAQNSGLLPGAQSRGIATLPGGIPLYRDTNGDGLGDTVVGGMGVFFPGSDGYATHEQGFVPGVGQTQEQRLNAPRVLEAEYIAYAAAGGSLAAEASGIKGAKIGSINGVPVVDGLDLPFGRIDLVGITLPIYGPTAGREGLRDLIAVGQGLGAGDPHSGADQPLSGGVMGLYRQGEVTPAGWLVAPHASAVDNISAADVEQIIMKGVEAANATRAAIRLPVGSRTKMVLAVTDTTGEVLGLYRMPDATMFSIDVAVAKARNVAYYADPADLQPVDQVTSAGAAFTNRTFRFLAEPRYPSGVEGSRPSPFSTLNDPGVDPTTAENTGAPAAVGALSSVVAHDAFFPMTNFRDPGDPGVVAAGGGPANTANQNGIVFFPGSAPLYKNGQLVGGLGVSGDGVDQDDVVTFIATQNYLPPSSVPRADQVFVRGVRLPYIKFLRNPFG